MTTAIVANTRSRLMAAATAIAALLLVPLVAMRFTPEVRWTGSDFVVAALLLGAAAIGGELAIRLLDGRRRVLAIGAVLAALLLAWAEGAVGIF